MNTPDLASMVHGMSGISLFCLVMILLQVMPAVCLVVLSLLVIMSCQFVCFIFVAV